MAYAWAEYWTYGAGDGEVGTPLLQATHPGGARYARIRPGRDPFKVTLGRIPQLLPAT